MKIIRRWHPRTLKLYGESIALLLRAPEKHEAGEFEAGMKRLWNAAADSKAKGEDGEEDVLRTMQGDFERAAFKRYVRPAEQIADENGAPIETGEQLYENVHAYFVAQVLIQIQGLMTVTVAEGKGSASPSGSSTTPAAADSSSAATSIGNGDGTAPSTALESLVETPSSMQPAEA